MFKKFNPQAFLEFACFAFCSVLLFYLTASGKYLSYVTPKMAPYLYFTSAVMFVWAISKIPDIFKSHYKIRAAHCLVLIVPMIFLMLPHGPVSTSGMSFLDGSNLAGVTGNLSPVSSGKTASDMVSQAETKDSAESIASGDTPEQDTAAQTDNSSGISSSDRTTVTVALDDDTENTAPAETVAADTAPTSETTDNGSTGDSEPASDEAVSQDDGDYDDSIIKQYGLELSDDGSIDVSDDEFYPWVVEIYTNMHKYEGVEIKIKGFVYKDSAMFESYEFVPARLLMYCCAADMMPCGITCEYDDASELEDDSWVTVTGVIHIGQYQGHDEPQISVTDISPAEKPNEEYVYPW